jgi:hypothetical protein
MTPCIPVIARMLIKCDGGGCDEGGFDERMCRESESANGSESERANESESQSEGKSETASIRMTTRLTISALCVMQDCAREDRAPYLKLIQAIAFDNDRDELVRCAAVSFLESLGADETKVLMADTLLGKLLNAIDSIPAERWLESAIAFKRPAIKDRAVSMPFIREILRSLQAAMPGGFKRLNSYMIQGCKTLDCDCDADSISECTHLQSSAKDPGIIKEPWVIRAFTAKSTNLSLIET